MIVHRVMLVVFNVDWPAMRPVIPGEMEKSRFTESQIVAVLKEGDAGVPVVWLVRKHGTSSATYYARRSKYAGVSVSDLKRMRELDSIRQDDISVSPEEFESANGQRRMGVH